LYLSTYIIFIIKSYFFRANAAVNLPFVDANAGINTQGANAGLSLPFADANVGLSGQGANANFNLKNPISSFNPVDLTSYAPDNIITTMVYALGILSLVNLLLGLIPAAEDEPEAGDDTMADAKSKKEGRSLVQPLANSVYQAITTVAQKYGEFQQL
jgi:hypothetical protein